MASKPSADTPTPPGAWRIETRRSGVHGQGVFALEDIPAGVRIIEYVGEIINWDEALRRHPHDPAQPNHTFYFHIDEHRVIDALVGGNDSRWINHSCAANCEADEDEGRIFIKSVRPIRAGEELNYDYGLVIDEPLTPELIADYPCWCGSAECRGTLLSSDLETAEERGKKKKKKKKTPRAKADPAREGKPDKKAAKKKDQGRKAKA